MNRHTTPPGTDRRQAGQETKNSGAMQRQASGPTDPTGPATGPAVKSTPHPVPAEINLSLTAMRYIVAVDTHRNFVRAAEACGVTQPTLSAGIRSIETALDVNIFDRGAHPVRPTALGKKIIAQARVTLHNASMLQEIVAAEKGDEGGEAVMGIIPTIAPYILPGLFQRIHSDHSGIHLKVYEMRTRFIIEKLLSAEIDMAILATPLEQKGLLEIPLYYEKFAAYISPADELYALDEIPADRLASDRLWILEEGHCLRNQVFNFCHSRRRTHTEYQAGSIDTLVRIVDTNGGYTVIPELHTAALSEEQRRNLRPIVRKTISSSPKQSVSLNSLPVSYASSGHNSSGHGAPRNTEGISSSPAQNGTPQEISEDPPRTDRPPTANPYCPTCIPVREVSLVIREDFVRERLLNVIAGCIKHIVPESMLDSRLKRFAIKL